jgi:hypothetical protein
MCPLSSGSVRGHDRMRVPWRHGPDQRFGGPVHLPDPPEPIRKVAEQKEIVSDRRPNLSRRLTRSTGMAMLTFWSAVHVAVSTWPTDTADQLRATIDADNDSIDAGGRFDPPRSSKAARCSFFAIRSCPRARHLVRRLWHAPGVGPAGSARATIRRATTSRSRAGSARHRTVGR